MLYQHLERAEVNLPSIQACLIISNGTAYAPPRPCRAPLPGCLLGHARSTESTISVLEVASPEVERTQDSIKSL